MLPKSKRDPSAGIPVLLYNSSNNFSTLASYLTEKIKITADISLRNNIFLTRLNFVRMEKKKRHGRRSRHLENRVYPGNGVGFPLPCRGSFSGGRKGENRRERRKTGKMKNRGNAEEDGNPSRASFIFFPARLRVFTFHLSLFPSPYEEKTKVGSVEERGIGFACKPLRNLEVRKRQEFHSRPRVPYPLNLFPHTAVKPTARAQFPRKWDWK